MMHARATLRLFYGFLLGFFYFSLPLHKTSAGACGCKNGCVQCNASEENNTFFCYGQRIQRDLVDYKCNLSLNYSKYELYISQRTCKKIELEQVSRITLSSKSFTLSEKTNMTAYAIARGEDQKNCIVAKFTGTPSQMIHCDPPSANNIKFKRRHGVLQVTAEWKDKNVNQYYLMYREQNNTLWKEVLSQNNREVTVKNLTSYLSYKIQIQCVVTTECPQCPPSHPISIPQELADVPDIKDIEEQPIRNGEREIIIKWQYVHSEAVEHYNVTVRKASGEPATVNIHQQNNTNINLILCYSAYHISIIAINSAGPSPPAYKFIKAKKDPSALDGVLNVSVKANNSFSLSWSKNLALGYSCYSVEWWESEGNTSYKSFFEKKSSHEVTTQSVTFQPYKRYHFFLHARPYKNTCNLKNINNSEVTYGRAQAYLTEGRPLTAPENVTVTNITQNSFVITWTPMDDEDMSGFLRGYVVYYTVDSSEKNVTVDPHVNSYELKNLASRNLYHVQLAAYTSAGVGRKSDIIYIETKPDAVAVGGILSGVVVGIIALLLIVHLGCRLLQRSKNLLWPSIPNPCNSNAVQKIEGGQQMEMLQPLFKKICEETEEQVSVVEFKKAGCLSSRHAQDNMKAIIISVPAAEDSLSLSPQSSASSTLQFEDFNTERYTYSAKNSANMADTSSTKATGCDSTAVAKSPMVFVSDYTTMEMFQQISKSEVQDSSSRPNKSNTGPSNPDYIRQALGSCEENLQHEKCFR